MHLVEDCLGQVPVVKATELAWVSQILAVAMCRRPPVAEQPVLRALDRDSTNDAQQDVSSDSQHRMVDVVVQTR